jgi:formylglycine-generating enzyme required for sulfatase activity
VKRAATLLLLAACTRHEAVPAELAIRTVVIAGTGVRFELVPLPDAPGTWIGRHEVTWDEYELFCNWDGPPDGVDAVARPSRPLETFPYDRRWGRGRRPAVGMSAAAAARDCEWLTARTGLRFRLPSEAEWESACGAAPADLDAAAWHAGNSATGTQEVGGRAANALGAHDLLGNLWEYVGDGSVLRGGSWRDPPEAVRPAARLPFDEDWTLRDPNFPPGVWWVPDGDHLGFRVLCEDPGR